MLSVTGSLLRLWSVLRWWLSYVNHWVGHHLSSAAAMLWQSSDRRSGIWWHKQCAAGNKRALSSVNPATRLHVINHSSATGTITEFWVEKDAIHQLGGNATLLQREEAEMKCSVVTPLADWWWWRWWVIKSHWEESPQHLSKAWWCWGRLAWIWSTSPWFGFNWILMSPQMLFSGNF